MRTHNKPLEIALPPFPTFMFLLLRDGQWPMAELLTLTQAREDLEASCGGTTHYSPQIDFHNPPPPSLRRNKGSFLTSHL